MLRGWMADGPRIGEGVALLTLQAHILDEDLIP